MLIDPHPEGSQPSNQTEIISMIFGVTDISNLHLFRKIKEVSGVMNRLLGEHRADHHVTAARMRILLHLMVQAHQTQEGGVFPSTLSRHLGVSRNTVSALLKGLEEQGLVERHIHTDDRRQILIRLTPAGQTLITEQGPIFGAFVCGLFESLTQPERTQVIALLDKVIASMYKRAEELGLQPYEPVTE